MKPKHHRVDPFLAERARELRRNATGPELRLWNVLRAARQSGIRFRRQAVIGPYIVDFYCAAAKLVIELDGMSHDANQGYDSQRTAHLQSQELQVVRYTNDDVISDVDAVAADIMRHIAARVG